jgi:hypothetical protein
LRIAAENRLKITYGLESFQLPRLNPKPPAPADT